jgi:Fe-S-cluster containining protein
VVPASGLSVIILRSHPHKHLPALEVSRNLFEARFASGCNPMRCAAACCAEGTTVDVTERDRILAHADIVKRAMSPGQDTDTAHWFEEREAEDRDFASGRAAYTTANENGCVFLDADRRCVLQRASAASGGALTLKPFFCSAFPIVIDKNVLGVDPLNAELAVPACCAPDPGGPLTVFDVCAMELEHVVGAEGVAELRRLADHHDG